MTDDNGTKRGGIPSWQRVESNVGEPTKIISEDQKHTLTEGGHPYTRKQNIEGEGQNPSLLDQARLFLQDETIKDAPLDQKIAFLEAKGLSKKEIESVSEVIKDDTAYSQAATGASPTREPDPEGADMMKNSPPQASLLPPIPPRDVPPIITYPEFLMHAQKPPPLITTRRLLNVAWTAAGVSAAVYGTSKYLIGPMSDSLTESRRDFAQHVQGHLEKLNSKLKTVVSNDPGDKPRSIKFVEPDTLSESGTVDSDPTELFHRDYGTQTSPTIRPVDGNAVNSSSASENEDDQLATIDVQAAKLKKISKLCSDLSSDSASEGTSAEEIKTTIRVLNEYLESLSFQSFGFYGTGSGGGPTMHDKKKEDDEVAKMKAEVRSIKGVLLSAKNFPGVRSSTFSPT